MKKDYIRVVVRGVILVNGHVLIAHQKGATTTFLPGGHAEFGESLPVALARELLEEIGLVIQVADYLGMVEHQWVEGTTHRHQINHVFAAVLPQIDGLTIDTLPMLESHEDHLEFFWIQPSELSNHNLLPSPLIRLVEHFVQGDRGLFWGSTLLETEKKVRE